MKKTYMQPTAKVFMLRPQMLLTESTESYSINSDDTVSDYDDLE